MEKLIVGCREIVAACVLVFSALFAACAQAVAVPVVNPGFEAEVHGPNTFTFTAPTGWADYNTAAVAGETVGTLNPATTTYFAPGQWGGSNVAIAYMDAGGTANVEFGIRQTLGAVLAADTIYTLTVGVGNIASGTSDLGGGPIFFDLDGFPGYRVELLAGTTLLAADLNSLVIPEGEFRLSQIVFDSTGVNPLLIGQPLVIGLVNLNVPDPVDPVAHREVDFDDVALDASPAALPAPATLALLIAGLALAGLRSRGARQGDHIS
ncbi:MAG: hypothetical protein KDG50_00390 [Chromatiales bacterium]|nr:hypothetical protein [Chromatiales bacterium]